MFKIRRPFQLFSVLLIIMAFFAPLLPVQAKEATISMADLTDRPMTRDDILARAENWVGKGLKYDQYGEYLNYRTDCSGYLSYAWHLTWRSTGGPAPLGTSHIRQISTLINKNELQGGDIMLDAIGQPAWRVQHVVIFDRWLDNEHSKYMGYEFTGSGVGHHEITYPYGNNNEYKPYRYNNIKGGVTNPTPSHRVEDQGSIYWDKAKDGAIADDNDDKHKFRFNNPWSFSLTVSRTSGNVVFRTIIKDSSGKVLKTTEAGTVVKVDGSYPQGDYYAFVEQVSGSGNYRIEINKRTGTTPPPHQTIDRGSLYWDQQKTSSIDANHDDKYKFYFSDSRDFDLTISKRSGDLLFRVTVTDESGKVLEPSGSGGTTIVGLGDTYPKGNYYVTVEQVSGSGQYSIEIKKRVFTPIATCPTITQWKGEYWNNKNLSGAPALCRNDANVDFSWEMGNPGSPINSDEFSARWTRSLNFDAGEYKFYLKGDDGIRLWVDGKQIINQWHNQAVTEYSAKVNLTQGQHIIKVEYYENSGGATVGLRWKKVTENPQPACTAGKSVDDAFMQAVIANLNTQTEYSIINTEFAIKAMQIWQRYENTNACWNPLATTWGKPGATKFNPSNVKNYLKSEDGASATANTIGTRNTAASYSSIRKMLALEGFDEAGIAANLKKYSGGGGYVSNVIREWRNLYEQYNTATISLPMPVPTTSISAELSCPVTAKTGTTVDCTLSIDPKGNSLSGLQIDLAGFENILTHKNTQLGALAGADPVNLSANGKIIWAGSNGAVISTKGVLATLTFDVLQAGTANITGITSAVDENNDSVDISFNGTSIEIQNETPETPEPTEPPPAPSETPEPPTTGNGSVSGKTNLGANAMVILVDGTGKEIANTSSNSDGSYTISAPAGDYKLKINAPGYLRAEKEIALNEGQTLDAGTATLLAGDLNGDDKIDPTDLISLGGAYEVTPLKLATGDWNDDGIIDLFDLTIFAENYRQTGPTGW